MATYYVYSGAGGTADGSDWTNAFTTLTAAVSGKAAGDVFYIAHDHAESTAGTVTLTSPGTLANPCRFICVNRAGSVPPVSADLRTTATVTTTSTSGITLAGLGAYWEGITFNAGTGAGNVVCTVASTAFSKHHLKNCSLRIVATGSSGQIRFGTSGVAPTVILDNVTLSFAALGQQLALDSRIIWMNTASALLGTIPTTLIITPSNNSRGVIFEARGVDLSAAGSGKTIVGVTDDSPANLRFVNCKIDASVTLSQTPLTPALETDFVRVGATGVNYNVASYRYQGTLTEETTIVRTGGASDGTTTIAWKIVTTANAHWQSPFESPAIAIWNNTTGSAITLTVEGIWGDGSVPNDEDIWIEAEYLNDANSPISALVNDSKADILASAAGQASSTETWGGSTTAFKMAVSLTAQQKGWIFVRVKAAKASSTFYVDPKITLS